jgi:hypothetical protein
MLIDHQSDVGDAYENQVLLFKSENIRYIAFDFHERCKGNRYENIIFLIRDGMSICRCFSCCRPVLSAALQLIGCAHNLWYR